MDDLQALTQTAVDDLKAIEPPEEAAEGHETLTGALEGYLSDIEELASAVESDDPEAAQEAALQFQEAAVDVQSELGGSCFAARGSGHRASDRRVIEARPAGVSRRPADF